MRWTKSQRELIDISQETVKKFSLDIVQVHDDFSGISTALRFIRRQRWLNSDAPRNITFTGGPWDVVMKLVTVAGRHTYGSGYLDTLFRAVKELAGKDKQPLCFWIDDVRHMRPHLREQLVCMLEHVADHEDIPIRVVMLLGKVKVWDFEVRKKIKKFVHSERLAARARKFEYHRDGLDEIRKFTGDDVVFGLTGESVANVRKTG